MSPRSPGATTARSFWCSDFEEAAREADRLAYEHVEILTRNPRYFLDT